MIRWTCGPFAEAERRVEMFAFRVVQQEKLQEILSELEKVKEIIDTGTTEEKLLASMLQLELEQNLYILLGVDDGQTENSEIFGKTIPEFIAKRTKT